MTWKPITLEALNDMICSDVVELSKDKLSLWNKIKVSPVKWQLDPWGNEGGGFWVVGIIGNQCLYYNDIEAGFNWGAYKEFGKIEEYFCDQDDINIAVCKLLNPNMPRCGPPETK